MLSAKNRVNRSNGRQPEMRTLVNPSAVGAASALVRRLKDVAARRHYRSASRSTCSSTPRPAQHPASFPSITTAGRLRMPCCLARLAVSW